MQRFEQIYEEHHDAVRAYVRRRAHESVVDDVVADTFVVCLRKIDRVPAEPLPWLYAVARKTLANERRKRARVVHRHDVHAVEPSSRRPSVTASSPAPSTP
jgi:RNA polymerase sigma-70 factor (ECF subfamily)